MKKRVIALLIVATLLCAVLAIPISAATSGNYSAKTIKVTTKANWLKPGSESITLSRTTGKYKNGTEFTGSWSVKVERTDKSATTKYYTLKSSSLKINLARNATYKITVSPSASFKACVEINGGSRNVKTWSNWYVSSTHKVSSYS